MLVDDSDDESAVVRKEKRLTMGKLFQKTNSKAHDKSSGTRNYYILLSHKTNIISSVILV